MILGLLILNVVVISCMYFNQKLSHNKARVQDCDCLHLTKTHGLMFAPLLQMFQGSEKAPARQKRKYTKRKKKVRTPFALKLYVLA